MTGFGRSTYENEGREYIIEIKSVNNRFTDINIKMPRNLNYLEEKTKNPNFTESKTLIVVGKTKEKFKKVDLVYFNSVNTLVVFYLINEETNEIYMDDSWISFIGLNYKKYVRKINEILNK